MTTISAQIIADSISQEGVRLTTLQCRYPRWIHAEFMTHRVFSRNASSSRAIPVERLIKDMINDPAMPMFWGKNQKGMQAGEECNTQVWTPNGHMVGQITDRLSREQAWYRAMWHAIDIAEAFSKAGYHKQIVNRLLEPFSHINVVCTATEWDNFFALRRHKDAEPHMQLLAERMWEAREVSTPKLLTPGEWHLPYITEEDWKWYPLSGWKQRQSELIKLSVARCARVSYLTHGGKKPDIHVDLALYDGLISSVPLHASPAEHQATPDYWTGQSPQLHGNLKGWQQYRKMLPNENSSIPSGD